MKKYIIIILLFSLNILFTQTKTETNPAILIYNYRSNIENQDYLDRLRKALEAELRRLNRYIIIENSQVDKILYQQKENFKNLTDQEKAINVGILSGAKWLLTINLERQDTQITFETRLIYLESSSISEYDMSYDINNLNYQEIVNEIIKYYSLDSDIKKNISEKKEIKQENYLTKDVQNLEKIDFKNMSSPIIVYTDNKEVRKVIFFYIPEKGEENFKIALAGTFNNWCDNQKRLDNQDYHMKYLPKKNVFYKIEYLEPGSYKYMYVINLKKWILDPRNKKTIDDWYGGLNSVALIR